MQPLLTNVEWSHIIDALKIAIDDRKCLIDSMLPHYPADDDKHDAADRAEWTAEAKRFLRIRRLLLAAKRKSK